MGKTNSKARAAVCAVFSFVLFLCITCGLISACSTLTLLSESHFTKSIDESMYAEKNYDSLKEVLRDEAAGYGLSEDLLEKQLDSKAFSSEIEDNIAAGLRGEDTLSSASDAGQEFSASVKSAVESYLSENKVGDNDRIKLAVKEIVRDSESYYREYIRLPFAGYFSEYRSSAQGIMKVMIPVCAAAVVVLLILLINLQKETAGRRIYICSSLIASGIAVCAAGFLLGSVVDFRFSKSLAGYASFIDIFFSGAAPVFWGAGIAVLILAVVIMVTGRGKK